MQWHKETKNWLGDCYKDIFICYVAMYTCMAWEWDTSKHSAMPDNEESRQGTIINAHDACKILSSVYKVLLIHFTNPFEIFCPNI